MGKLRIAVCDDDPIDLANTISMIEKYDKSKTFDIVSFTQASPLLNATNAGAFDILLLEIGRAHV